ncbi:MAG TPA: ABC transporter ATP-binding protein, partial [Pseudogracilibacillus sp.]|nr:ABC transporter ATP-binding protein [Pseudogracilibacillus sp.]
MSLNNIKEPFLHKKINLDDIKTDQKSTANKPFLAIKRIGSFLIQEKIKLSLVILMVVFSSALSLLGPFLIGITIDDFISTKETSGLIMLLVFLGLVYLGHSISVFLQNFWMVGIAQNTVYDLRESLFEHFHELPISYFDENLHGELMSRVTNDIDNINNTLNQSVIEIFTSVLTLIGTLAVMLYLSPLLTLITMSIIPLMILAMRWITSRTGPLYKLQQQRLGIVNGYVEESISGQHVIKTFSQEERVIKEFQERNKSLNHASFWAMLFSGFIPKVMNLLNFLSFGLIALFGGILAIKGHITVGVIVIFTEYARQFTRPLNELSNQFNILLSAIAGAERVFDVLDTPKETQDE